MAIRTSWARYFLLCLLCLQVIQGRSQKVALEWVRGIGGIRHDQAQATIVDGYGNTYTTGYFAEDSVDFDPDPNASHFLTCQGSTDIFVVKLDAAGKLVWVRQFGSNLVATSFLVGADVESGQALALDINGHLLVAGQFAGTADFDPGPGVTTLSTNGLRDAFILKLDTGGNFMWAHSVGGPLSDAAVGITTDKSGNVYTTGTFSFTVDFDPGTGIQTMTAGLMDIFVLKLNPNGNFIWARQGFASGLGNAGHHIVMAPSGQLYISAYKRSTMMGGLIWKMDEHGNILWSYTVEGNGSNLIEGICLDQKGDLYATGSFEDSANFNGRGTPVSLLGNDAENNFILKLDTAGILVWVKQFGGSGRLIGINPAGNIITAGSFAGTVDFDPGPGTFNLSSRTARPWEPYDIYVLTLNKDGLFHDAFGLGGEGMDNVGGLAIDQHGSLYLSGMFGYIGDRTSGTLADFDPGTGTFNLSTNGDGDIYIAKLFCTDTSSISISKNFCDSFTFNNKTYTQTGAYKEYLPNAWGCDSIITLNLTQKVVEPTIAVQGFELTTTTTYSFYQWYLNHEAIPGATERLHHVSQNGEYTVKVVDYDGCSGESDVYVVSNVSSISNAEVTPTVDVIRIAPNPATHTIQIRMPQGYQSSLYGIDGRLCIPPTNHTSMNLRELTNGLYWLRITDNQGRWIKTERIAKIDGQ